MNLTTQQVAEKLGVSNVTVATLARMGKLPTSNKPEPGKRVAHRFDAKVVAEFKKTYMPIHRNGNGQSRRVVVNPSNPPMGLLSTIVKRLNTIDDKLDHIIALWS
jgi:hypothetical protein